MKLNLVPAGTGIVWLKLGIRTFFKQPLAMSGLFFMFMAAMSVLSFVPLVGTVLALMLLPAATLGLMAATHEATKGKFPLPSIMLSAFRAGRQRKQAMLVLGACYALGFLTIMGISALIDGGQFAKLYLVGGPINEALVMQANFQRAMWVTMALYLPFSLLFWHAPALVHWYGISPLKSLFFSAMACYKNFGALCVFGLAWFGIFLGGLLVMSLLAAVLGNPNLATAAIFPLALIMASMFFTSLFFTFRDSFIATSEDEDVLDLTSP